MERDRPIESIKLNEDPESKVCPSDSSALILELKSRMNKIEKKWRKSKEELIKMRHYTAHFLSESGFSPTGDANNSKIFWTKLDLATIFNDIIHYMVSIRASLLSSVSFIQTVMPGDSDLIRYIKTKKLAPPYDNNQTVFKSKTIPTDPPISSINFPTQLEEVKSTLKSMWSNVASTLSNPLNNNNMAASNNENSDNNNIRLTDSNKITNDSNNNDDDGDHISFEYLQQRWTLSNKIVTNESNRREIEHLSELKNQIKTLEAANEQLDKLVSQKTPNVSIAIQVNTTELTIDDLKRQISQLNQHKKTIEDNLTNRLEEAERLSETNKLKCGELLRSKDLILEEVKKKLASLESQVASDLWLNDLIETRARNGREISQLNEQLTEQLRMCDVVKAENETLKERLRGSEENSVDKHKEFLRNLILRFVEYTRKGECERAQSVVRVLRELLDLTDSDVAALLGV